jgi:glutamate-1-semialdehyde 2,1-aminomutase
VWDVDGNEYIDCISNFGALVLGHGDPDVVDAVKRQLDTGLTVGLETELNIQTAEKLIGMIPSAEMVRFSNSGTEAVMHAIQIARGYTGRQRIVKAEGNYHGWYDYIFCNNRYPYRDWLLPKPYPTAQGLCRDVVDSTLVVPWNDLEKTSRLVNEYKAEIAAVIIEPVNHNIGCAVPRPGYLEGLRELTEKHGIVLIFDEIITGFRAAPGGAQEYFKVTPDISTFGKAIANGFPISLVAGKKKVMEIVDPVDGKVSFGGTYNAGQTVVAAASATLDKLKTGAIQQHLHRITKKLVEGFNGIARQSKTAVRMQGFAGKFQVYFLSGEVVDWRTASASDTKMYDRFQHAMLHRGILWSNNPFSHHGLTAAHTDQDIERILAASEESLKQIVD